MPGNAVLIRVEKWGKSSTVDWIIRAQLRCARRPMRIYSIHVPYLGAPVFDKTLFSIIFKLPSTNLYHDGRNTYSILILIIEYTFFFFLLNFLGGARARVPYSTSRH